MRIAAPLLIALLSLFVCVGCELSLGSATSVTTYTHTTEHLPGTILDVSGVNGTIEIIAKPDREDVLITAVVTAGATTTELAEQRLAETSLEVIRDTNRTLTITTSFPSPSHGRDTSDLTVHLPSAASIQVVNVNGAVQIRGFDADVHAESTNGRLTLTDITGNAVATSVNGRITTHGVTGSLKATTTNGRIELTAHNGPAEIKTVNGRVSVELTDDQPGPVTMASTNGRLALSVGHAFRGQVSLRTSNGSIDINDGAGIVNIETQERRTARAIVSEDGEESTLRTQNGSVTFTTRP
jgi:DUF4097 and DUF4098 domain-containing protein YvlB